MTFYPSRWTRFAVQDAAIWLCPDRPEVRPFACAQRDRNPECLGWECPLWP